MGLFTFRFHGPDLLDLAQTFSSTRVCQPEPVAFRAITSSGSRSEIGLRGFEDLGRPAFLTLARTSISFVSVTPKTSGTDKVYSTSPRFILCDS